MTPAGGRADLPAPHPNRKEYVMGKTPAWAERARTSNRTSSESQKRGQETTRAGYDAARRATEVAKQVRRGK